MTIKNRLIILLLVLLGGATAAWIVLDAKNTAPSTTSRNTARPKRPNIILIVIDTLRADHLGCYGYERDTTPHLDRFAQDGLLFRNAISAASWTLPSIGSLLTSQYPCVLGVKRRPVALNKKFPLLSEVLKQYDYKTCGIVSHVYLSARLGFAKGFDSYDESSSKKCDTGTTSPAVTYRAISFLREKHKQPFFLFLHYFDPHYNYLLHKEFDYYPTYRGDIRSNHPIVDLWRRRNNMSKKDIEYLVALHDSEIAFNDREIGKLLDELKKQGLYDDSIIIITADHGEEFMERGWIGHCITLYQELIHVPLIMKFPGCEPAVVDSPVALIDIMPTILGYMGLDTPANLEGQTLDVTAAGNITGGPIFSETFNHLINRNKLADIDDPKRSDLIAFRSMVLGQRKLIYDQIKNSREIYDLSADPHELNNLSDQQNAEDRMMESLLSEWIKYVEAKQEADSAGDTTDLFTPEQKERLKSLGYL